MTQHVFHSRRRSPSQPARHAHAHARHTGQRGNALLYTLLALVLGGIGVSLGVAQYREAEQATTVQSTVAEVNTIIGATKQNFGQYDYVGLTTDLAVGMRIIPANNKFGGAVTLVAGAGGTALLTYAGVPATMCVNILNATQSLARQVRVGGTNVKPLDGTVDLAALSTQCAAGGAIEWTIGRT